MYEKGLGPPIKKSIIEFFDDDYKWWETIYENDNKRGFLSYEMVQRKELIIKIVEKHLKYDGNEQILDCGCGPGEILRALRHKGINVVGVDINENFIKSVGKEFNEMSLAIRSDIETLPFNNESFDIVFCAGVLSYLKEDERALSEISRVLKNGGVAIITFPNLFPLYKFLDPYYFFWGVFKYIARKLRSHVVTRGDLNKFNESMIRKYSYWGLCKKLNFFKKLEVKSVSFGPFTLLNKTVLTFHKSKKLSNVLTQLCQFKYFKFFNVFSSRWIFVLQKV